jgi:chromate reductase
MAPHLVPDTGIQMNILGISGSLRAASYNSMALRAAQKLAPAGVSIEIADIGGVPMYNDDIRAQGDPTAVTALRSRIEQADALLIVSPEYNFSIPGVLKNALDWVSRSPRPSMAGKPVALMGCGTGPVGTARMQYDLRKVLVYLDAFTVNKPEVFISHCASKFDAHGALVDEATARVIIDLLTALQNLRQRIGRIDEPARHWL